MRDVRNEKRNLSCSVVVLGLALVASTACWAQSSTIGGNPIFQRQGVDSTGGDFFLVDTNNPFTADGDLTNWEIFAGATHPVQLVIYRNIGGNNVEVARSALVTPTLGYNLFSLNNQPTISVKAGDFVGAHTTSGAVISNSVDDHASGTCFTGLFNSVWFSFSAVSTALTCSQNRHYSLRATGQTQNQQ
jgi:hypothetical protein